MKSDFQVPNGWEVKTLGELASFRNGLNFLSNDTGHTIKVVGVGDFKDRSRLSQDALETVSLGKEPDPEDLLQDGDLLFVRSNGNKKLIGRCVLIKGVTTPLSFSGFTIRARLVSDEAQPDYVGLQMQSETTKRQIQEHGGGTNISNLSQSILAQIHVPIPPKREQTAILDIFSTWDTAIETTQKLIEAKKKLKKGLMQQLLTGKRRFPEFVNQPWPIRDLCDIGSFVKGKSISKSDINKDGAVPALLYGELYTTYDIAIRRVRSFVSPEIAASSTKVQHGDILFPSSGETADEIATPAVYLADEQDAVAGGDIVIFRPRKGDPLFLSFALNAYEGAHYRWRVAQGQSVVHIYTSSLKRHPVPFPSIAEQRRIAVTLDGFTHEIALLQEEVKFFKDQKKGLMQMLLTGQIRVRGG